MKAYLGNAGADLDETSIELRLNFSAEVSSASSCLLLSLGDADMRSEEFSPTPDTAKRAIKRIRQLLLGMDTNW